MSILIIRGMAVFGFVSSFLLFGWIVQGWILICCKDFVGLKGWQRWILTSVGLFGLFCMFQVFEKLYDRIG